MLKLIVAFRNFANAPKNGSLRRTYTGTRNMLRYKYTACLDRNSVQEKSRTATERTVLRFSNVTYECQIGNKANTRDGR